MAHNSLTVVDAVILVAYFLIVSLIGLKFSKDKKNPDAYFVTKRRIPGWIMGLSMFAATLSSFTFVGFPGWTYRYDMQILLREYMSVGAMAIATVFIIPIYRAVVNVSVFEYLELRYGYFARAYTSIGIVLLTPVGIGVLLYVLCLALNGLTGIPLLPLIIVVGAITLIYTMWGGIEGCIYTEAIHGAMFIGAGLLALVYLLFFAVPGGATQILEVAQIGAKFKLMEPTLDLSKPTLFLFMWVGLFHFLNNYTAAPYMVQRYVVAPSYRQAIIGSWLNIATCLVTWAVFMGIGALLWAFYQINPDRLAANIEPDAIFPFFIGSELPRGVAGLILAGLLASGMSGISSALNSTSACLQSDFLDRWNTYRNPAHRLSISRVAVLSLGIVSLGVAFLLTLWRGGVVQFSADVIASILGPIFGGGQLAIFGLGLFTRRTSRRGMYVGIAVGILFSMWAILTNPTNPIGSYTSSSLVFLPAYPWHSWLLFGLSNLVVALTAYAASLLLNPGKLAAAELTVWGRNQPIRH